MLYAVIFLLNITTVVLLFTKISIEFALTKKDVITAVLSLFWGPFMHKIKLPFSEMNMEGLKGKKQVRWGKKKKQAKEEKKKLSAGEVFDRIKHIRALFFSKGEDLKSILEYLLERLKVKKLTVTIFTGGNEASGIALKAGFAFSVIGILDSILSDKLNIEQKYILIQPNYSLKKTSIDLNCIMKLRFVNIIIAAIRFGYAYRKFEREGSRCGNVTSN